MDTIQSPCGGGLGWGLPAYRRCPVAIPVSFQNFRVRVGYAATHPTHEIRHRVRLGAPSGAWRRLCDGGASPTLRTAPSPCGGGLGWGLPAYRRCPVAIPVSFQNFRVRVGYAATHPTHEIHHRVRLGAPSGEDSPPKPGQAAHPARNFVNIAIQCPESHDTRSSA